MTRTQISLTEEQIVFWSICPADGDSISAIIREALIGIAP